MSKRSINWRHTNLRQRAFVLAVLLTLGSVAAYPEAAAPHPAAPKPVREVLPATMVPLHYDLALSPDAQALTFQGTVAITLEVKSATRNVTLNAVGLTFDHATIDGGKEGKVTIDEKLERVTLGFGAPLIVGRHTLSIAYHGKISHSTLGFFAMDYTSAEGPRRTLATNFEPAAARELLPCWDEPGLKATFTVSVDAPKDRMALSNMPVAEVTSLSPTLQRVKFARSPKMSTYLLYVGIGDFERVHQQVDGVDVGVVVKRGDLKKADYALDQAVKLLHFYNDYFGVAYPLPKLDLIAAPGQITGGSMENWGAIFYSQNHLLFDPTTSTEADRQLVFEVVAHEMAHQWFGDLVTMAWWSDLWLNEGFARWMQTFAADALHPEWETNLQSVAGIEEGKQIDAGPATHPVVQPVYTADQAEQSFDSITYEKGAAIIFMLNGYVGSDKFRDGVRRYMKAHAYGNTVDTDLWQPMQEAVGQPIVGIEHDFTRQEGVPLVRVTSKAATVHLELTRFAADPATIEGLPLPHWHLPIATTALGGTPTYTLLNGAADIAGPPTRLVNAGQLGYARVAYTRAIMDTLAEHVGSLQAADQIGLLNDAQALSFAGMAPASDMLALATQLPADANPLVWRRVIGMLTELDEHYTDSPERAAYRHAALATLEPLTARLGDAAQPNEPANDVILRSALKKAEGRFGDAAIIARARQVLDSHAGSPGEQRTALNIVAAHADAATFDLLLQRAETTADPLEKFNVLSALASVEDAGLARRMLDLALSDQAPAGSAPDLLITVAAAHPELTWEVIAPRLDQPALPMDKATRWRVARTIAGRSATLQRIADLQAYEARNVPVEARKPFLAAVASIQENRRIVAQVLPQINAWLATRVPAATAHLQITGATQ
jgi:aminopeptidase N